MTTSAYEFTVDWFSANIPVWDELLDQLKPLKILEIGSFEGRSACHLIEKCSGYGPLELVCVDTWQGGMEHDKSLMGEVERRFDSNIAIARARAATSVEVRKVKAVSAVGLAGIIHVEGPGRYDLVYIDGSHQAPDVLTDAVMSFQLLRVGGLMFFDDYLWGLNPSANSDPMTIPKPAIDAFLYLFQRKIAMVSGAPGYQLYVEKTAD